MCAIASLLGLCDETILAFEVGGTVNDLTTRERGGWRAVAGLIAVVVFCVAAAYAAAQALGWIAIGELPGENAPGFEIVNVATIVAFLLAFVVAAASLKTPELIGRGVRELLPVAAVAVVVVGHYTYDPY